MARVVACWRVAARTERALARRLVRGRGVRGEGAGRWIGHVWEHTYLPERKRKTMLYRGCR